MEILGLNTMANLSFIERNIINDAFKMNQGYVLDFSDKTLQEFMNDFEVDLNSEKYKVNGKSKAKRLNHFLNTEDDHIVYSVIDGLLKHEKYTKNSIPQEQISFLENIINKLKKSEKNILNQHNNEFSLFISHISEHKDKAVELKEQLAFYGVSCFVAHEDIEPRLEWQVEIEKSLESMDAFVTLCTEGFNNSVWTNQEIGFAIARKVCVFSIRMGEDLKGFIGKYQALKFSENIHLEILESLMSNAKMVDSYIDKLKKCRNWSEANQLAICLPYMQNLNNNQIELIIDTFNTNIEISGSFEFNGERGLVYHLERITNYRYEYDDSIIRVIK